jgi:hypothetical protein
MKAIKENKIVDIGSVVEIYDCDLEEKSIFTIVSIKTGKNNEISFDCALGEALLGKAVGERVVVKADEQYEVEILTVDNSNVQAEKTYTSATIDLHYLLKGFYYYCKTPGIDSGKAQSYVNAIQYLCDFLGVHHIDEKVVAKFKNLEFNIYRSNSDVRNNLLTFLKSRRQSSYLTGGFIRAALKYFYPFWEEYKNKNI